MKLIVRVTSFISILSLLFFASIPFVSCEKEKIIKDTIVVVEKDTVRIIDSACYNLKDGLVAWYSFNGKSLKDGSGKNNDITFNNAIPTNDRFGKADNAYLFNGTSSYMSVPNSASLNPQSAISIMSIIKVKDFYRGTCHANNILSKGWDDYIDGFYALRYTVFSDCYSSIDTTKEVFYGTFGDYNNNRASASNPTFYVQKDKWINIIYTYENGKSKIYIDGVLKDVREQQNASFIPNDLDLTIGKHGDPQYPYYVNGIIDEVRIYNKALCEGEVKQLNNLKE